MQKTGSLLLKKRRGQEAAPSSISRQRSMCEVGLSKSSFPAILLPVDDPLVLIQSVRGAKIFPSTGPAGSPSVTLLSQDETDDPLTLIQPVNGVQISSPTWFSVVLA